MKILVVDDEESNSVFLRFMLEIEGHEIFIANDGQQAVEQAEAVKPDLILMDIMMPVMDGYEATRIIKKNNIEKFLPIIFVTALSEEKALISSLENGGDDCISKPVNKDILLAKISVMQRTIKLHRINEKQKVKLELRQQQQEQEMQVAEEIFSNMLHKSDLDIEFIHSYHKPADTFNGDVIIAVRSPRGGLNALLGDFTGHGLVAAICALPVVKIFYSMSLKGYSIQEIGNEINRNIFQILPKGKFLCANLMYINRRKKYLEILNAGMPDVLLCNHKQGIRKKFVSKNIPLGIVEDSKLDEDFQYFSLEEGDRIFAYSDGLLEAESVKDSTFYGQDKLEEFIESNRNTTNMVNAIRADLVAFCGNEHYRDDVSMLEVICDEPKQSSINKQEVSQTKTQTGCWDFTLRLDHNSLKNIDAVAVILSVLMDIDKSNLNRETLFCVISEIYRNALDHGVLQLDNSQRQTADGYPAYYKNRIACLEKLESGFIDFKFRHQDLAVGGELHLVVEDSGEGFDVSRVFNQSSHALSGTRYGFNLIKSFCRTVSFNEQGNKISVVFTW